MDIYSEITKRIIDEMEGGVIPWQKPWVASGGCVSYATGKPYSLLNQMLLGAPGEYATFKQIQQAGGYVRKGEKAHLLCQDYSQGHLDAFEEPQQLLPYPPSEERYTIPPFLQFLICCFRYM